MKMTNMTLVNTLNFLQQLVDKKLPQKINYAIIKNLTAVSKEYEVYEKQLKQLYSNYDNKMKKDKNGQPVTDIHQIPIVSDDVKDEFQQELADLLNFEINVDMYYIDPEAFNYDDAKYDAFSARDIINMQAIMCAPEKEDELKEEDE